MAYIKSTEIKAFPAVNRLPISGDIYARHTSEETISGIVNKLIDTDGFVITSKKQFKLTGPFSFNLHGYYFKIAQLQNLLDSGIKITTTNNVVYAEITLEQNGYWEELKGLDETDSADATAASDAANYTYRAISFFTANELSIPESEPDNNIYRIPILKLSTVAENNWVTYNNISVFVPNDYYIKFNGNSFTLSEIDGGDMDSDNIVS